MAAVGNRWRPNLIQQPGVTIDCGRKRFIAVSQSFDEAVFLPLLGTGVEVVGAEVLIHGSVLEHVIDGREDRSRDGDDRLLGATPGSDAVELSLQIAVFLARRRPGTLHECGFEPGRALANARGSALARTLVVARTEGRPMR